MATEVIYADSPSIVLNSPLAGQSLATFGSLTYTPGTNELFVFHNGIALVLGVHYLEPSANQVTLLFLPDNQAPDVDVLIFQTIVQGSSAYVPPPISLSQASADRRPHLAGQYVFDP